MRRVLTKGKLTSVTEAAREGKGKILSDFRQVPAVCCTIVEDTMEGLKKVGR